MPEDCSGTGNSGGSQLAFPNNIYIPWQSVAPWQLFYTACVTETQTPCSVSGQWKDPALRYILQTGMEHQKSLALKNFREHALMETFKTFPRSLQQRMMQPSPGIPHGRF